MRDILKLGLVLGIRLDAQRGREDELADGSAEAGEEGVEWLFSLSQPRFPLHNVSMSAEPQSHPSMEWSAPALRTDLWYDGITYKVSNQHDVEELQRAHDD